MEIFVLILNERSPHRLQNAKLNKCVVIRDMVRKESGRKNKIYSIIISEEMATHLRRDTCLFVILSPYDFARINSALNLKLTGQRFGAEFILELRSKGLRMTKKRMA